MKNRRGEGDYGWIKWVAALIAIGVVVWLVDRIFGLGIFDSLGGGGGATAEAQQTAPDYSGWIFAIIILIALLILIPLLWKWWKNRQAAAGGGAPNIAEAVVEAPPAQPPQPPPAPAPVPPAPVPEAAYTITHTTNPTDLNTVDAGTDVQIKYKITRGAENAAGMRLHFEKEGPAGIELSTENGATANNGEFVLTVKTSKIPGVNNIVKVSVKKPDSSVAPGIPDPYSVIINPKGVRTMFLMITKQGEIPPNTYIKPGDTLPDDAPLHIEVDIKDDQNQYVAQKYHIQIADKRGDDESIDEENETTVGQTDLYENVVLKRQASPQIKIRAVYEGTNGALRAKIYTDEANATRLTPAEDGTYKIRVNIVEVAVPPAPDGVVTVFVVGNKAVVGDDKKMRFRYTINNRTNRKIKDIRIEVSMPQEGHNPIILKSGTAKNEDGTVIELKSKEAETIYAEIATTGTELKPKVYEGANAVATFSFA